MQNLAYPDLFYEDNQSIFLMLSDHAINLCEEIPYTNIVQSTTNFKRELL